MPELKQELKDRAAVYFAMPSGWLAFLDRATSSLRTCAGCSLAEWERSSRSYPKSGMLLNGRLYPREPLALPTSASASSSWPTPQRIDSQFQQSLPATRRRAERGGQLLSPHRWTLLTGSRYYPPEASEYLMGFPLGWTELEPRSLATLLCPRSPSTSGAASSRTPSE